MEVAERSPSGARPSGIRFRKRLAIGDPQAPLGDFFEILDRHGALGPEGRLLPDVQLVSAGDHFDWGELTERSQAIAEGLALLAWLASHPSDQVILLLGNHDLARVCELAVFRDDAQFAQARADADAAYRTGTLSATAFALRHPDFSSPENLSRDLSTFSVAQRRLVQKLLEARRFRIAHAADPSLLLVHGAVTEDDLARVGAAGDAVQVAATLNGYLDRCVETWDGEEAFDLQPLHRVQGQDRRGIFFQIPTHPAATAPRELQGPPRRRYDPRRLPRAFAQAVGHVRDAKCRSLLGPWVKDEAPPEGGLRSLWTDGQDVTYQSGCVQNATVIFIDGGMRTAGNDRYELLDLDTRQPADRVHQDPAPPSRCRPGGPPPS